MVATEEVWTRSGTGWRAGTGAGSDGTWLRAADPADAVAAGVRHGLPEDLLARCFTARPGSGRTRPHVDLLEDGVTLVAPTLRLDEPADVVTGELRCLVVGDVVVTTETGDADVLDRVADRIGEPQPIADARTGGLLSALLSALVEAALDVEDRIAEAVVDLERVVFSPGSGASVESLYALKREIAEARRAVEPLGGELADLVVDPDGGAAGGAWVRRLVLATDRLDRRLADHDQRLDDMLSAHLTLVTVAQNDQMRAISAWAATLAVPTLVGTVYGMNFVHMPELHWVLGYPLALAVMATVGTIVNVAFRRSGWL